MWSREWIPYVLTSISGIGIITNLRSFRFIRATFNVQDNLFNILAKDSVIAASCLILQFATDLIIPYVESDWVRNEYGCVLSHYGSFVSMLMGPPIAVLISSRRLIQLKYPTLIKLNSRGFNIFSTIVMSFVAVYYLAFMIIDLNLDLQEFHYIGFCLGVLDEWIKEDKVRVRSYIISKSANC